MERGEEKFEDEVRKFSVTVEPRALDEIQETIYYYESLSGGLGEKFYQELDSYLETLQVSPFFQIRYKNVRCLPLKVFPYMIHFTVDERSGIVYVHAVINCHKNPETNWLVNEP